MMEKQEDMNTKTRKITCLKDGMKFSFPKCFGGGDGTYNQATSVSLKLNFIKVRVDMETG